MKTKRVGPDQDGRFYQVKLTKLEGIKEWFKQDDLSRADIAWLIAEVTKLQNLTSQQTDPYAQGQEDAAKECAEIADTQGIEWASDDVVFDKNYAAETAEAIRKEYSL